MKYANASQASGIGGCSFACPTFPTDQSGFGRYRSGTSRRIRFRHDFAWSWVKASYSLSFSIALNQSIAVGSGEEAIDADVSECNDFSHPFIAIWSVPDNGGAGSVGARSLVPPATGARTLSRPSCPSHLSAPPANGRRPVLRCRKPYGPWYRHPRSERDRRVK